MRGKLSSRFVRGLALLILGGACALGVVAVPALAGTSSSTPTSTAPGVTTAAPRTPAGPGVETGAPQIAATPAARRAGFSGPGCLKTLTGRPAHCARPVPASRRPAGTRNRSPVTTAPASGSLASLVDTRTWTTGGGNTFPGADVPFGMVQWSPDTMPTHNAGGGYNYTRHDAVRLQPDPRLRAGLRRRGRRADPADHRGAAHDRTTRTRHDRVQPHRRGRAGRLLLGPEQRCRTRSPRSSPRPRTARWARFTFPSTSHGRLPDQAAGQPERRHRRHARRSSATTRSRARSPAATSAARPTTTASPSCTRCTSTSSSASRSPRRR